MKSKATYKQIALSKPSFWDDIKVLVKLRLNILVVFSAVIAFLVLSPAPFSGFGVLILAIGGFLVTGAANALNQVLESDFDKLMKRTENRPVAAGRMKDSEAVLIAGLMAVVGVIMLCSFNALTGFLGMLSMILYAFVYTPLKRFSTLAVPVGAIPGALPMLIGATAATGEIGWIALLLFGIQFFWQFPHFWAIGWNGKDDYMNAGFKLLPERNGVIDPNVGLISMIYALLLIPISVGLFYFGVGGPISLSICVLAALYYTKSCWDFQKHKDTKHVKKMMYASFIYLPVVLIALLLPF